MKIGIDLDGVVIDSEQTFRTYEEIFDIDVLHGNNLVDRLEPKFQTRYNWTKEEEQLFIDKYFRIISKESNLMPGFKEVYKLLRNMGYTFIVITARGGFVEELKDDAIEMFEKNGIEFDKYYWHVLDKLEICQKEDIDIMIDDDFRIIESIASQNIKTLYFKDVNLKELEQTEYITEVNNWGDIYRYFINNQKNVR